MRKSRTCESTYALHVEGLTAEADAQRTPFIVLNFHFETGSYFVAHTGFELAI